MPISLAGIPAYIFPEDISFDFKNEFAPNIVLFFMSRCSPKTEFV